MKELQNSMDEQFEQLMKKFKLLMEAREPDLSTTSKSEPEHHHRVLICGSTEEDDCLCVEVGINSTRSVFYDVVDHNELVFAYAEEKSCTVHDQRVQPLVISQEELGVKDAHKVFDERSTKGILNRKVLIFGFNQDEDCLYVETFEYVQKKLLISGFNETEDCLCVETYEDETKQNFMLSNENEETIEEVFVEFCNNKDWKFENSSTVEHEKFSAEKFMGKRSKECDYTVALNPKPPDEYGLFIHSGIGMTAKLFENDNSSRSLVNNTVIGGFEKKFHVASKVFDEIPESMGYISCLNPKPPDENLSKEVGRNLAVALAESGALERYGVELIGTTLEDQCMEIANNREEFEVIYRSGLATSVTSQVLVEKSLLGWKEYELEVMRDLADNLVIKCSIENIDAMGVHTGDSITVAPAQTLTDKEYQRLKDYSIAIINEIGVECGGSNVQFAISPVDELATSQARMALNMLRENRNIFDLIISDVHMPDMDGFKLLELVGLEMDLPGIMLSANSDPKLVMKGITQGACDYLVKPVRIEEFRNIWQHVIQRKKVDSKSHNKLNSHDRD